MVSVNIMLITYPTEHYRKCYNNNNNNVILKYVPEMDISNKGALHTDNDANTNDNSNTKNADAIFQMHKVHLAKGQNQHKIISIVFIDFKLP